jgi:hypothetical protein
MDRPVARREVTERSHHTDRKENRKSTFHCRPRKNEPQPDPTFPTSSPSYSRNIRNVGVTGRLKVVN